MSEVARDGGRSSGARACSRGIGARTASRQEDDRYLRGRGRYIADIRRVGMFDMAFVRSPLGTCPNSSGIAKPEDSGETGFHQCRSRLVSPGLLPDSALAGVSQRPSSRYSPADKSCAMSVNRWSPAWHRDACGGGRSCRTGRRRFRGANGRRGDDHSARTGHAVDPRALGGKRIPRKPASTPTSRRRIEGAASGHLANVSDGAASVWRRSKGAAAWRSGTGTSSC